MTYIKLIPTFVNQTVEKYEKYTKMMAKRLFVKSEGNTAPKSYTIFLELMIDLKSYPLPKMAHPIQKGYTILEAVVIYISHQTFLLKTQVDLKKKLQRIIFRQKYGKVVIRSLSFTKKKKK